MSSWYTNLKKIRERKGLSQKELADKSGIKQATLSLYENNKREYTQKTIEPLARALGCTVAEIMATDMDNHHIFGSKKHITNSTIKEVGRDNIEVGSNTEELKELREYKEHQEARPISKESHLRLIVEWIEREYGSDPIKGLHFFQEFQEKFPEFEKSLK